MEGPDFPRQLVESYLEMRAAELSHLAQDVGQNPKLRLATEKALLKIAAGEEQYEDLATRIAAVDLLGILGLSKSRTLRRELLQVLRRVFSAEKLNELALFDALPRRPRCNQQCSELKFLGALLRVMLQEEPSPEAATAEQIATIFSGTRFGKKVRTWLDDLGGNKS